MERIYEISRRLIDNLNAPPHRYLYDSIASSDLLIMIKGARGVGKTTMMQQKCKEQGEKILLDRSYLFEVGGKGKRFFPDIRPS